VDQRLIALLPIVGLASKVHALLVETSVVEQDVAISAVAITVVGHPNWV
jgi:hypothetical protein